MAQYDEIVKHLMDRFADDEDDEEPCLICHK